MTNNLIYYFYYIKKETLKVSFYCYGNNILFLDFT